MLIKFSSHSLKRLRERSIPRKTAEGAIRNPDKLELSRVDRKRLLIKKLYYNRILNRDHLLIIVCEKQKDLIKVITIIDTSKISKYF
jgi:hypothetical protein